MVEFLKWMILFVFIYYVISSFLSILLMILQFFRIRSLRSHGFRQFDFESDSCIPVSLVVSISDDENMLLKMLDNLQKIDYPEFEILMVYDGKNESFLEHICNTLGLVKMNHPYRRRIPSKPVLGIYEGNVAHIHYTLIQKEVGGLGDSYNAAFNLAKFPYVFLLDEHISIRSDAFKKMMYMILSHNQMVACGGLTAFQIPSKKLLFLFQKLEYQRRKILGYRKKPRKYTSLNSLWMIRKEIIFEIGGFQEELHEDVLQFMVSMDEYCWEKEIDSAVQLIPEDVSDVYPSLTWGEYFDQDFTFLHKILWEFLMIVLIVLALFLQVYSFYPLVYFYFFHLGFEIFFQFLLSFLSQNFLDYMD